MRDQIIDAFVKDFVDETAIPIGLDESEVFERFANHCIVSKYHPETFEVEDICVGGGGDLGIDGLAILVNDHLVTSSEQVDYLKKELRRLEVKLDLPQLRGHPEKHESAVGVEHGKRRQG
jgi:hypothetical protein